MFVFDLNIIKIQKVIFEIPLAATGLFLPKI